MFATSAKRIWRLAWLAVMALHIPAVLRLAERVVESQAVSATSCLLLVVSLSLFAIELIYCPLLAVCSDRKRFIAVCLIIAIGHVGLIEQPATLTWITSVAVAAVALWYACNRALSDPRRFVPLFARDRGMLREAPHPRRPQAFWLAHPSLAPPRALHGMLTWIPN